MFARVLLGTVFAFAVVGKLLSARARSETVEAVELLLPFGERFAVRAAQVGLALELIAVGLLGASATAKAGLILAGLIIVGYTATLAIGVVGGRRIMCNCFGTDGEAAGFPHLLRNTLLVILAGVGTTMPTATGYDEESVVGIAAGVVVGWLLTRWDDLVFLGSGAIHGAFFTGGANR